MKTEKDLNDMLAESIGLQGNGSYYVQALFREEDMSTALIKLKNGTFALHLPYYNDEHLPAGVLLKVLTEEDAADWWVEHFVPEELLPYLRPKQKLHRKYFDPDDQ